MRDAAPSDHDGPTRCPSPAAIMALIDHELDEAERAAILAHVESCSRCRQFAGDISASAAATKMHLSCLDDESVAAYVDYRARRVRGTLSADEVARMRQHLAICERCRDQVALLAQASGTASSLLQSVRSFLSGAAGEVLSPRTRSLRWTMVGVAAAAAVVAVYLMGPSLRSRGPTLPAPPQIVHKQPSPTRQPGEGTAVAKAAPPQHVPGGPREARPTDTHEGSGRKGQRKAQPVQPHGAVRDQGMETALVSPGSQPTGTIAQAQREASVAAKSGDAGARADAEIKLARLYHRERDYPQAVRHYRRAAAAAEGAHKPRLRVDALILLGGSLAEMSQTAEARRQLELAQQLARQADYTAGEQNAVLQLEQLRTSRREGNE